MNTHRKILLNQNGQVIIIATFIMVLALAIGISVSNRFISGIRNISEADNSSKALSLAEAAVEKILLLPSSTLESYITNNNCGTDCQLEITDTTGQRLTATVSLSYTGQTINAPYPLELLEGQTVEVFLQGYTSGQNVYVCWNTDASIEALYVSTQSSTVRATPYAANAASSTHTENGFSTATSLFGYYSCLTVPASNTPQALRIKSYYRETEVHVLPASGYGLPIQGIQIQAVGMAGNARRKVTVIKTNSYLPTQFDYVSVSKK
jgi:hypothetical protein